MIDIAVIIAPIVSEITRLILGKLDSGDGNENGQDSDDLQKRLGQHLTEVVTWARQVQFFGMARGENTQEKTIPLLIDTLPRKFKGDGSGSERIGEHSLLADHANYLILGDPGSGKTTALKRLANSIILGDKQDSPWQFPLVIRLRSVNTESPIEATVANTLGIGYSHDKDALPQETKEEKQATHRAIDKEVRLGNGRVGLGLFVGDLPLEKVVCEILDNSGAVLLIDGLDEVPEQDRIQIEESIISLTYGLSKCKILLSCRSGDYVSDFPNFQIVELCPLDMAQVSSIAERWLPDAANFLKLIADAPFSDLSNRPLLLCQLIVFYRNAGYLPRRPSGVYQKITRLLLEDWDRRRRIRRKSTYAFFGADEKLDFLSSLSYYVTYRIKAKRFSREDLESCYRIVHREFELPGDEMEAVVSELESHTGIIAESGLDHFEFSHLSLQEFLCARYLVRDPDSEYLVDYMREYPSPVAVATSLASNKSNWFARLFLKDQRPLGVTERSIVDFLSRLEQEKPSFPATKNLGLSLLKILLLFGEVVHRPVVALLRRPGGIEAFAAALEEYYVEGRRSNEARFWLVKKSRLRSNANFFPPEMGPLARSFLAALHERAVFELRPSSLRGFRTFSVEILDDPGISVSVR